MFQFIVIDTESNLVLYEGPRVDCTTWVSVEYGNKSKFNIEIVRYKDLKPQMYPALVDFRRNQK